MSAPKTLLGILSNLYVNSGTYGSPTWDPVKLVGDLSIPQKWDAPEILIRQSRMKFKAKTALGVGITGKLLASYTDAQYLLILAALTTDDVLDVMTLTGADDANGATGWRFDAQVHDASQDQGAANVLWSDFELAPALTSNTPKSVTVTGAAPVFTAF